LKDSAQDLAFGDKDSGRGTTGIQWKLFGCGYGLKINALGRNRLHVLVNMGQTIVETSDYSLRDAIETAMFR
jgi:hypothetical protein